MSLFARIRAWAALKLLGQSKVVTGNEPMTEAETAAIQCAGMSNGRMVIIYDTDHGAYVRTIGMAHEEMLHTLRSSADQIDMATAARSTKH